MSCQGGRYKGSGSHGGLLVLGGKGFRESTSTFRTREYKGGTKGTHVNGKASLPGAVKLSEVAGKGLPIGAKELSKKLRLFLKESKRKKGEGGRRIVLKRFERVCGFAEGNEAKKNRGC